MADAPLQPIIIKKMNKGHGGHHGGAWKIAYADFVTAMMAFFLLLWLLNSVTQEQLEGISNYFAPVTASTSTSGSGDILGGKTITEEGASESSTSRDAVTVDLPPPKAGSGGESESEDSGTETPSDSADPTEEQMKKVEEAQFEKAKEQLEETIAGIPQMKQLAESLLIDNTPEGLRIQLIDQDGLAMFPSGGADMYLHTKKLIELVAKVIVEMPQKISISGHTDGVPFISDSGYSNWELSADRANSARREVVHFKVPEDRISQVVGKAATEPLLPDDPNNSRNRRLSIILLRGTGEQLASAAQPPAQPKPANEALPGLNEIKRQQLQGTPAPAGGMILDLAPRFEAQ
ncbi:MAG: flagellar motor protein MotB [Rhodospirillales bacterium]|nr:flagellar motor protein MotB [Rhodospirillales bacterium]